MTKRTGLEKIYSVSEIAELLALDKSIVRKLIKSGTIKTSKHATRIYIVEESDLKLFRENREEYINKVIKEGLKRVDDEWNEYCSNKTKLHKLNLTKNHD